MIEICKQVDRLTKKSAFVKQWEPKNEIFIQLEHLTEGKKQKNRKIVKKYFSCFSYACTVFISGNFLPNCASHKYTTVFIFPVFFFDVGCVIITKSVILSHHFISETVRKKRACFSQDVSIVMTGTTKKNFLLEKN